MSADFTPEKEDYKILTPFKMQVLTNFPYIEADFDALTNYQLLCKIVEYLNNVIHNENEITEQVNSLYNAYVSLQNYVNNYFDNLDVQEEINNKLDEMAEDGTLSTIIGSYINPYLHNMQIQLNQMDAKIDGAVSGSPLVASSTDEMTDTTRVYVNTTDGKWYYYDGDSWEIGGTYQSTSDSATINSLQTYFAHYAQTLELVNSNRGLQTDFEIPLINGDIIQYISNITIDEDNPTNTIVIYGYKNNEWVQIISYGGNYNSNDIVLINDNYEKFRFYYQYTTGDENLAGNVSLNIIRSNNFNEDVFNLMNKNAMINLHTDRLVSGGWVYEYVRTIPTSTDIFFKFNDLDSTYFRYISIYFIKNGQYTSKYSTYNTGITANDLIGKIIKLTTTEEIDGVRIYYAPTSGNVNNVNYEKNKFNLIFGNDNVLSLEYSKINTLSTKYFSICGVSIDTYAGYIPEGNLAYYNDSNLGSVNYTWWKRLINNTGINMIINNSWTGSRATTSNGVEKSGVHRCLTLDDGVHNPDIIFLGAFALNDWYYSDLGNYQIGDTLPGKNVDLTDESTYNEWKDKTDKYEYAMATMFYRIQDKYPNAKIYVMDAYNYYRNGSYPTYYQNKSVSQFNESLYKIAKIFGIEVIKLSECGITYMNSRDLCVETGSIALHPNADGQELLYNEILKHLV